MEIPVIIGQKKLIAHPNHNHYVNSYKGGNTYKRTFYTKTLVVHNTDLENRNWYFNDHCFICDKDENIHLFGINNPYPDNEKELYVYHPYISHFVKLKNQENWEFKGFALDESNGTNYLGAPYVIWVSEQQRYIMIFESLIHGERELEIATSKDLCTWERTYTPILTNLAKTKRDPCILKENDKYLIFLCNPKSGGSTVSVAQTYDFTEFECTDCLHIDDGSDYGGIESPFVVKRNGTYYLFFTYAHRSYNETLVIASTDYKKFDIQNCITTINSHAGEVIKIDGTDYISSCGPEDIQELNVCGVTLSKLEWITYN